MSYSWVADSASESGGYWAVADAATGALQHDTTTNGMTLRDAATTSTLSALMTSGPLSMLDTSLAQYVYKEEGGSVAAAGAVLTAASNANSLLSKAPTDTVTVDFVAKNGDGADLLASLQSLGLQGGSSFGSVASGSIAVGKLLALTSLPGLGRASLSTMTTSSASQGSVVTQADAAQHDDIARATYGVDGTGIKVGVLSDSFNTSTNSDTEATDITSGDLPADTTILQDHANGTDEGRAMAQLVHDLAPNASIAFATASNGVAGFANNILALANAGAKVIVDDVGYFAEPAFEDSIIAQAVNQVAAQGVSYFSAAGNDSFKGFEAAFNAGTTPSTFTFNGTTYTAEQFSAGQTLLPVTLGGSETIELQWDQPYLSANSNGHGSASDLDLFLTNANGTVLNYGDGTPIDSVDNNIGGDPSETISISGAKGLNVYLEVGLKSGAAPTDFKLMVLDNGSGATLGTTASNTNDGTTYGHAAATGATAVGAAPFNQTPYYNTSPPVLENFSSGGPTRVWYDTAGNRLASVDVRQTPTLTAVDGGNTTFFTKDSSADTDSYPNFYGTSAAAPDAAATAALMIQARSTLTPTDIRHLLMDSAIDMDNPDTSGFDTGYDNGTGTGLIQADLAVGYASTLAYAVDATHRTMIGSHLADTFNVSTPGAYTLTGAGGSDVVAGTGANLDGGTVTDFATADLIHVTDASLATLTFAYNPGTGALTFSEGLQAADTINLPTGLGTFGKTTDPNGGVDLAVIATPLTVTVSGVSGATNSVSHTVSGTVDTTAAPQAIGGTVSVDDGGTSLGSTTIGTGGSWSLPTVFEGDGPSHTYNLTATATDSVGDTGMSSPFTYGLDFTPNRPSFGSVTTDSSSGQGEVYALYDGILSRTPDISGWEHFLPAVNAGESASMVADEMLHSAEYTQQYGDVTQTSVSTFLTDLYQSALGRAPDTPGMTYWQQQLANGATRADVAVGFSVSVENENQLASAFQAGVFAPSQSDADVTRLFYGVLGRDADGAGQSYWESTVQGGASLASVAQGLLGSQEYANSHPTQSSASDYVNSLYMGALGRSDTGDPGATFWVDRLNTGTFTRADVAVGISTAPEAMNHLQGKIETGFHLS